MIIVKKVKISQEKNIKMKISRFKVIVSIIIKRLISF